MGDARKAAAVGLRLAAGAAEAAGSLTESQYGWVVRASAQALRGAANVLEAAPGWAGARVPVREAIRLIAVELPGVRPGQARVFGEASIAAGDVVRGWVLSAEAERA